jgi:hypothetical protein
LLKNWATKYGSDPAILSRMLFGSDFDVLYFTAGGITLQQYNEHFVFQFSKPILDQMMRENSNKFLG